ncbi:MAG: HAMP domain-containing histidine kinase, partial [Anaerolineales bacterium]
MWSRIKQFIAPPQYQDAERALVTNLLNTLILILLFFALLINLILPLINPDANYWTSGALLAVAIVLFVFIRYGGYRGVQISSVVLCGALWLLVTLNGWMDEGLRNMASITFFVLTIMAGLLLGGKGAVIFGLLSIGGAFYLYFGEITGLVRFETRGVNFGDWVKFVLIEVLLMFLIRFTVLHLLGAMDRLRMSEHLLAEHAEELSIANAKLRTLGKAKDEFVANVSHELRSPITSLIMYEDLLTRRPDRLNQYLPILKRETVRLGDLIEDMLNISRLDQGRIELKLEQFDLNELIQEFVIDRTPLAESRGLGLDIIAVADLPMVTGDRG